METPKIKLPEVKDYDLCVEADVGKVIEEGFISALQVTRDYPHISVVFYSSSACVPLHPAMQAEDFTLHKLMARATQWERLGDPFCRLLISKDIYGADVHVSTLPSIGEALSEMRRLNIGEDILPDKILEPSEINSSNQAQIQREYHNAISDPDFSTYAEQVEQYLLRQAFSAFERIACRPVDSSLAREKLKDVTIKGSRPKGFHFLNGEPIKNSHDL